VSCRSSSPSWDTTAQLRRGSSDLTPHVTTTTTPNKRTQPTETVPLHGLTVALPAVWVRFHSSSMASRRRPCWVPGRRRRDKRFRDSCQGGGRRCRCGPMCPDKVTAGHDGSPSPSLAGVDLDMAAEGWSADKEREAGVRGVPGLFADSDRAPATNPTGRATRSSRAPRSSRACPRPSRPVWRRAPLRSPADGRASW